MEETHTQEQVAAGVEDLERDEAEALNPAMALDLGDVLDMRADWAGDYAVAVCQAWNARIPGSQALWQWAFS